MNTARRLHVIACSAGFVVREMFAPEPVCEMAEASEALNYAIELAGSGEVMVEPGDYPLMEPVRLRSRVTLRGRGRGSRLIVTRGDGGVGVLGDGVDGARVVDLAVTGPAQAPTGTGVRLRNCGDCRVTDVFALDLAVGVELREHSFLCEVRHCQLAGCVEAGVVLEELAKGRVGDYITNSLQGLLVYGGGHGLRAKNAIVVNITACSFFQTGKDAIRIAENCNSVLVSGCRTFQITGSALVCESSNELNVTGNIFCWHTEHGIVVRNSSWGCIVGNEVIDSGSVNPGVADQSMRFDALPEPLVPADAIRLEHAKGFNISGNALFNWPQGTRMGSGVVEDAASADNTIVANNVNYYGSEGGEAVRAHGARTLDAANLGARDEPHVSTADYPLIQSFETHRLRAFIAAQR